MVSEQHIPSKAELLKTLRSREQTIVDRVRSIPIEEFEQGRYENGWTGRQILAHVASIEWTYPRLIDLAKQPPPAPSTEQAPKAEAGSDTRSETVQGGIESYNERQVEKRAEASVEELLEEFQKNRAATIAAVEAVNEALLSAPILSAGGIRGALGGVINAIAVHHVLAHVDDIIGTD